MASVEVIHPPSEPTVVLTMTAAEARYLRNLLAHQPPSDGGAELYRALCAEEAF